MYAYVFIREHAFVSKGYTNAAVRKMCFPRETPKGSVRQSQWFREVFCRKKIKEFPLRY